MSSAHARRLLGAEVQEEILELAVFDYGLSARWRTLPLLPRLEEQANELAARHRGLRSAYASAYGSEPESDRLARLLREVAGREADGLYFDNFGARLKQIERATVAPGDGPTWQQLHEALQALAPTVAHGLARRVGRHPVPLPDRPQTIYDEAYRSALDRCAKHYGPVAQHLADLYAAPPMSRRTLWRSRRKELRERQRALHEARWMIEPLRPEPLSAGDRQELRDMLALDRSAHAAEAAGRDHDALRTAWSAYRSTEAGQRRLHTVDPHADQKSLSQLSIALRDLSGPSIGPETPGLRQ